MDSGNDREHDNYSNKTVGVGLKKYLLALFLIIPLNLFAWSTARTDYFSISPVGGSDGDMYDIVIKCGSSGFPALFEVTGPGINSVYSTQSENVFNLIMMRVRLGYNGSTSIRWNSSSNSAYCSQYSYFYRDGNYYSYKKVEEGDFKTASLFVGALCVMTFAFTVNQKWV